MNFRFEWDRRKAATNLKKHQISFEEAQSVFLDPFILTIPDDEHSEAEDRFINIGMSERLRVLVVVHTERMVNVIRIISCRQASPTEREMYEEGIS
jgi:hypothetical protein